MTRDQRRGPCVPDSSLPALHPHARPLAPRREALNDKTDRLLALQGKVDEHSQVITRLKTIWSFVAAGIALVVAALKDWLFGQK